jgi:hypothetical protein
MLFCEPDNNYRTDEVPVAQANSNDNHFLEKQGQRKHVRIKEPNIPTNRKRSMQTNVHKPIKKTSSDSYRSTSSYDASTFSKYSLFAENPSMLKDKIDSGAFLLLQCSLVESSESNCGGQAGVAICYNKNIANRVDKLPDGGNRVVAIRINTEKPIVIICVYLPTRSHKITKDDYIMVLDEQQS